MDPITLALMGGTAISSIMGGQAASDTAQTNADISMLNYYAQQQAAAQQQSEARRQQQEGKLGTTDATGNRTYFVPGQGWVTDLTPQQEELMRLTEGEQRRQLLDETARNERVSERGDTRRGREDTNATEAEREMRAVRRPDESALRDLLLARGAETRNRQADRAGDASARAAIRGGGTNAASVKQGARAEADADSARQAGIEAQLMAKNMADSQFAQGRDSARGIYDYFRRASTSGTAPVTGVTPTGPTTRSTGSADQQLINAFRAPQLDYQSPNNAMTDTASGLMNMFGAYHGLSGTEKEIDRIGSNQGRWQGIVK